MKIFTLRSLVFSFVILVTLKANSQVPGWAWAKSAGGTSYDNANGVATDASGNSYVVGYFASAGITFGSTGSLNNAGSYDLFVVKYDINGTALWARRAGGSNFDGAMSVAVDKAGFVYVSGYYASATITFGTITLTNDSSGKDDIFLVKYDTNGNVVWARNAGGKLDDYVSSIAVDDSANIYIGGGFYSSSITFGSSTLYNIGGGYDDLFLAKYDSSGNALMAVSAGGTGRDAIISVSIDTAGNVYAGGVYNSDSLAVSNTILNNSATGYYDICILKYDRQLQFIWAVSNGGDNDDFIYSVAADNAGNVVVAGIYNSSSVTFNTDVLTNAGKCDLFIAKYDADGNALWGRAAGGDWYDYANAIAVDNSGNIYVTGHFLSSTITFGSTTLTKAGAAHTTGDLYLAKYDGSGNALWAESGGGSGNEIINGIALDNSGNIYIAGNYTGNFSLGLTYLTNADNTGFTYDVLVAKTNGGAVPVNNFVEPLLSVFPNPTSDVITISVIQPTEIFIYTMEGQMVRSIETDKSLSIDVSSLDAGIYIVKTTSGNNQSFARLVKQ